MSKYIKTNNFEVISFQINYKAKCGYQQNSIQEVINLIFNG